jgi:hypothetical protein
METRAFAPLYSPSTGTTAGGLLASTTIAASTTHAENATAFPGGNTGGMAQLRIANTTAAWAYVNLGQLGSLSNATVAASLPIAPATVIIVSVPAEVNGASVILGTGTGNVIFTRGEGL